jgi:hypothetical protein
MRRLLVLALLLAAPAVRAAPEASPELAALVPQETILLVEGNDLDGKGRFGEGTAIGKLLAEPEVQIFTKKLGESLRAVFAANAGGPLGIVGLKPDDFDGIVVRRAGLAVVAVAPEARQVDAVLYLETRAGGEKVARILKAIRQAVEMFTQTAFTETDVRGRKVISTAAFGHEFCLAAQGDRFVFTTRAARMEEILKAIDEGHPGPLAAAPRMAKLRERMGAQRNALLGYLDAAALLRFVPDGMPRRIVAALGVDAIESMGFADVPEGALYRTEGAILVKERRGLLALAQKGPPSHRFATMTPGDALCYGAEICDLAALWDGIVALAADAKRGGLGDVPDLAEAEKTASGWLGVNLKEDLLKALGTEWAGYVAWPGAGGGVVPDAVLFASVRDREKLVRSLDALAAKAHEAVAPSGGAVVACKTTFRGTEIRFLELTDRGEPIPLAPAWAFGEDFVVFGLWPQSVKHALMEKATPAQEGGAAPGSGPARGLAGRADFRQLLAATPRNATSATYVDLGRIASCLYATAVPLLQGVQGAVNRPNPRLPVPVQMALGGLKLNFEDLPTADVVARHLSGFVAYTCAEDDCIRVGFVSQFGAPLAVVPIAAMAGVAAAVIGQAHARDRVEATQRARAEMAAQQAAQQAAKAAQETQRGDMLQAKVEEMQRMLAASEAANQALRGNVEKVVAENDMLKKRLSDLEAQVAELLKASEGKK